MVKLSEWLKNWNRKRKRREESPNNALGAELAPNKFLRPLAYKEWQIVGNLFEFNETSKMHKQTKLFCWVLLSLQSLICWCIWFCNSCYSYITKH